MAEFYTIPEKSICIYLVSKAEMLSCIFVHVRVYILLFMNFFESKLNDLIKTAWRNMGTLDNQLRGQTPLVWSLARKHLLSFLCKSKE